MNYRSDSKLYVDSSLCKVAVKRLNFDYSVSLMQKSRHADKKNSIQSRPQPKLATATTPNGLIEHLNMKLESIASEQEHMNRAIRRRRKSQRLQGQNSILNQFKDDWDQLRSLCETKIDKETVNVSLTLLL